MPRWVSWALIVLTVVAALPFACIAQRRASVTRHPRLHVFFDMDNQPRFKAQQANPFFEDGRELRPPVEGTVARGELRADTHLYDGRVDGDWATTFPLPLSRELLERGRNRFEIYCAPCHGLAGYGDGMITRRAEAIGEGGWVPPTSLHDETVRNRPVGHLYNTVRKGVRTMPAYGPVISVQDRWAIVAYVRALQRSQHATMQDVPPGAREALAE